MVTKFGVIADGFNKKEFSDIIESLHINARHEFGNDVDLTPSSPIKMLIDMFGAEFVGLWNELELTYKAAFLPTATDSALDSIGKLVGATRGAALYATGKITFYRTTPLPSGSARKIPIGTKVATATARSVAFYTTESVYFESLISNEMHTISDTTYTFDAINYIYEITEIYGIKDTINTDYIDSVTFSGRTITFNDQIDSGTVIYISYKPLSVTASIIAEIKGADSNVAANTISVMETPIDFIHSISNEDGIDTGSDVESDSHFRAKIIGATEAIGKATSNALEYYIGRVTGVKNVIIEDPLRITATKSFTASGTSTFYVDHAPIYSISSVLGSNGGYYNIESFDTETGSITLTTPTMNGELITIIYVYTMPGKIKIYVEGGEVGDADTEDTIVYAIEHTRAAGIQAVGYGDTDPAACGDSASQFSYFYRPNKAEVDVSIVVYFDENSVLTEDAKETILTSITTNITDYINELSLEDKIYKNKLLQIAISTNEDIVDAQLTSWYMNGFAQQTTSSYLQTDVMTIAIANNIIITKASE